MRNLVLVGWALGAALAVAGCSDDVDDVEERLDYEARIAALDALNDRIGGDALTPARDLPTRGAATFDGFAAVNVDSGATSAALIGDATMVADFGDGTIEGRADDFFGRVDGGATRDFDGALVLSDGRIGDLGRNSATADMDGTLRGGGHVVEVDADLVGAFTGRPLSGLAMGDLDGTVRVDGVRAPADVAVIGER